MEFDYETLLPELRGKIALESNYKDLLNLCKTSREAFGEICGSNGFWKQKTYYDFGDLYDIEKFEGNWWDTYQYYRSVFTLDLIKTIKNQEPLLAEGLLMINEERQFLMVDGYNEKERTALIYASKRGYTNIVRMLLEAGADPNLFGDWLTSALMYASWDGYTDIVRLLLKAGADPNLVNYGEEFTALMFAVKDGFPDVVKVLLENGADPNIMTDMGQTALITGLYYKDIVRLLLENGANPNLKDNEGNTALIYASKYNLPDAVEVLLENGAEPKIKSKDGQTAFQLASQRGYTTITEILLDKGIRS